MALEKRGIPAAMIGEEYLVKLVGPMITKLHGMPDYPAALIKETRFLQSLQSEDEIRSIAKIAAPQVEAILVQKR